MSEKYSVEMRNIDKKFGGVHALKDVSVRFCSGEIHSLVGENGAGKSTLIKILSGMYVKDSGELLIHGKTVEAKSVFEMKKKGVDVIYQEFALAPDCTVAENIYMNHLAGQDRRFINWKQLNKRAENLIKNIGFNINPREMVGNLSVAYQQIVEIAKALSADVDILVLDEPTAVLTVREIEKLFALLRKLKKEGVSIIYISHRLEEIFELCDSITVMKDGAFVDCVKASDITKDELIRKMVGRELSQMFPKRNAVIGDTIMEAKNINGSSLVKNITFSVKEGEVLGFYGLVGAGRTETMRAIFGADRWESGELSFLGKSVHFTSPKQAVNAKLGMLPEDRKKQGVLLQQSIKMNTSITAMKKVQNSGIFNKKKEKRFVQELLGKINTKYASIEDDVSRLSGGNQQKVALAKWLAADCKCIIFDEPTRGVDVGAKTEIYSCINQLAEMGLGIIMISSEMPELMGMCDRILIMHQGEIKGALDREEFSEDNIIFAAMGGAH